MQNMLAVTVSEGKFRFESQILYRHKPQKNMNFYWKCVEHTLIFSDNMLWNIVWSKMSHCSLSLNGKKNMKHAKI